MTVARRTWGSLAVVLALLAIAAPGSVGAGAAGGGDRPERPVVVRIDDDGFHWRDAGLGAAAACAAGLIVLGLALSVRAGGDASRRRAIHDRRSRS